MAAMKNLALRAPVVVSSANLSKKSFWNFVHLVIDPTSRLKYHVEA
jgi:hypothetical protein